MAVKNWKENLLPFFLMLCAVLFDGFVASYFGLGLHSAIGLFVPRTILLVLILLTFYYPQNFMFGNAALIGFIMDAYYLGFLGIYMVTLLLAVAVVSSLKRVLRPNMLSYILVSIIVLTQSEMVVYGIMRVLGLTTMGFQVFLVSRLSATLLFNGLIMLVGSYFVQQLIVDVLKEA